MGTGSHSDPLLEGRRALDAARWDDARAAFEAALDGQETPDALDGLGQALWFLESMEEGIASRALAFEGYVRESRCDEAARVAVWVSRQHFLSGRASAARGWLSRAERALEGVEPCEGHGWVAVERARHADSVEERAEHARRAMAIARGMDAGDLEVFALSLLGGAEIGAGRRDDGMGLLEEAMAAASAGRWARAIVPRQPSGRCAPSAARRPDRELIGIPPDVRAAAAVHPLLRQPEGEERS